MKLLRPWLAPIIIGLAVPLFGLGAVPALTAGPVEQPVSAPDRPRPRPSPSPAAVESFRLPDVRPAPPERPVPAPPEPKPEPEREAEPEPTPEPTPEPEPAPQPVPAPSPEPAPVPPAPAAPIPAAPAAAAAPVPPPPPAPPPPAPPPPSLPAQAFDLTPWKLTLPIGSQGHPLEVRQPDLGTFSEPDTFRVDAASSGVVFRARAGGVTTRNSKYPRAELREMTAGGGDEAAWSNAAGSHVMTITQAITAVPPAKPHVVAGQIHDEEDDVLMIRLEGTRLFVESDGDDVGVLDPAYVLGTRFTVEIAATPAGIRVTYNGARTVDLGVVRDGLYFKAGCYTQSNPSRGDSPDAFGEVVIYALTVRHA